MDLGSMSPLAAMDRAMANLLWSPGGRLARWAFGLGRQRSFVLLAALVAALGTGGGLGLRALGHGNTASLAPAGASAASVPLLARAEVSAALGEARDAFHVQGTAGVLRASNPTQGLQASFDRSGTTIASQGLNLSLSLRSIGYGEGSAEHAVAPATPAARANRVTYSRGAVSEWYANGPAGLEHGLPVATPPTRAANRPAEPLTVTLALAANARPKLAADGELMTLERGAAQLRYGNLLTTDASGRALRTWLQLQGTHLLIQVDAAQAAYPLRIDP